MAAKSKKNGSIKLEPSQEEIRKCAQDIYEKRMKNNLPGDEQSDWFEAKKELSIKLKDSKK